MERVYLDTCVWCRLFDVLDHKKIRDEFRAVSKLIDAAREGKISVVKSEVIFYEISKIETEERNTVEKLVDEIAAEEIKTTGKTKKIYENIAEECGLKAVDALHIALAIENKIDVFLTTDDEILNRRRCVEKHGIVVKNPTEYEVE
ncbi:MAG: PIN domain-containing protein [Methanobacteriota archaeon]